MTPTSKVSAGRSRPAAEVLPGQFRTKATNDVDEAVSCYIAEGGSDVATRFVDGLERTIRQLELHPELGLLRFAFELDLPGVRSARVDGFQHLIFYLIRNDHLDVLRVLHSSRDVPATLRES